MRLSPTLRWVLTADMSTTGPFRRLRPARALSDELITHLAARIMSGEWQPSDKMPTEQEMIAEFGVSRTVVREAIAALKAEGLVQTRQGAGAFVCGVGAWASWQTVSISIRFGSTSPRTGGARGVVAGQAVDGLSPVAYR